MARNWTFELKTTLSADGSNSSLFVDDTAGYLGSPSETANVPSAVFGLESTAFGGSRNVPFAGAGPEGGGGTVTVSDTPNPQAVADVASNGNYSAGWWTPADSPVTSSLLVGDPASQSTGATGNVTPLDADNSLTPTLSVNAKNPADVVFTVSGLGSGYSGTVTFTDTTNKSDVVAIKGNGTYAANLSNLTDGTLTYLLTASNPAGNVITVDPTTTLGLPPGVTLQPINGGANYYAANGLTYAVNAGWDNPSFIPIGPWEEALNSQAEANTWQALGWNTSFNIDTNNALISVLDSNGISLIQGGNGGNAATGLLPGTGAETVGFLTYDESSTYANAVSTPISTTPNSVQDGRFWYMNETYNFLEDWIYGGPGNNSPQAWLSTPVATPDGATRTLNSFSVDQYFFTGANNSYYQGSLGNLDNLGKSATPDEVARGSNYGDLISYEEAASGGTTPIFALIETGGPSTSDTSAADYITPPELNWGVWSSLIHGANGIIYFDHSFGGPAQSDGNLYDSYYQTVQPGQTVSMYTQVQETDALVEELAPVLNSPTALGYVTVNTPSYENGQIISLFSGIEVMAKDYNGQFYIFADTADSLTQTNISATFTIADTNATEVVVVGENRTIPVVNGVFTDKFATAATVHIYEVIDSGSSPPPPLPAAPVISTSVANSNASVTLTGTAPDGSTVTVSDNGGTTALGTVTASSTGAWSFTTADLAAGSYAFTATDTTSAGTSAAALVFVNVASSSTTSPPAAPVISTGVGNSNASVTLTGTAPDGSTVTVSDTGGELGTPVTASSTGTWSFTTADLAAGSYAFTATDTTSAGTSAASSAFDVTVTSPDPPAAPVISTGVANSNESVTLTGTAPDGSTVTVSDGSTTALGTATASSTGAWSFTTADLSAGPYAFTATDTTSAGTSAASSAFDVTVPSSSPPPSGSNLVANGNFATDSFSGWTLGGNYTSTTYGPEIFIDTDAEGGSTYAAGMGSVGSDGTLSQTIATTAGQTYTLSFWLQNEESGTNDFTALWNGQTLLSLSNAAASGYTEYTYTVTATGSSSVLEFSAMQDPSQWDLDNISLTANATSTPPPPAAPVISTGAANSNESMTLTGTAPDGSTVTVSDGGTTALGTATASSTGAWSFTTADLSAGSYAFTATDTTSAGTSAASSPLDVSVTPPPAPAISSIVESPSSSDLDAGETVTLTLTLSKAETVAGGTPTLTLNDGGIATYTGGSGTSALTFNYTVAAGQNTPELTATAVNLNSATITNSAGIAANLSLTGLTQSGPQIDTTTPAISSIAESPSSGDLNAGKVVTITLDMTEVVTVNTTGGSPTLTLNDGGTATYVGGSGTNALTFSYTVLAGQNTPDLMETAVNLDGATIQDGAGNAANLSLSGLPQGSPQIDTTTPVISSIAESPSSGDLDAGKTVTLTLNLSEAVTVAGGTPTLTLNDGGTATYTSGTGTNALTFSYTVGAGQSTSALAATAVNLNGATIEDGAGNAANVSLTGLTQTGPQIPPAAPVISTGVANSNESVTLTGTAPDGSTVTVSDGGAKALGTATASSTGAWSFTTADLSAGSYAFTATDTTSAGTSAASSPLDVTVTSSSPPPSGSNLVANGNFATDSLSGWTRGGNYTSTTYGPEIFIDTDAEGGSTYAAGMGSVNSDGTLSQTIATTAGQTYTLSFWLQNEASGTNDFKAIWNGQTLLSLSNAARSGYTEYTYTVTATGSSSVLEFSAMQNPSQWDLDNISLTANSTPPPAAPVISTGVENSNESVTLTGTAPDGSTVTVSDGGAKALGTATASSTGAWSFTTAHLSAGSYAFTATDTTSAGNLSTASSPLNVKVNANLIGAVTIGTGATLELTAADSASVTFGSSTGTLILESPSTFSGEIFNFTGNGSLSGSDQIDLTNINFNSVKDSYANGVLTVTDGTHTDKLDFNGSYKLANFDFASDGSGGTIVYDPPVRTSNASVPTSSGQTSGGQGRNFTGTVSGFETQDVIDLPGIAFDAQATLGYLPGSNQTGGTLPFMDGAQSAKIALLGNYMASSFAVVGDHHSDSMVTEAWQASNQSLLSHPQHT